MTDPTIPTYGAVRAAYVRDREQRQRRHTRGIPTDEQRAAWAAEFDRWADAIHPPFGPIPGNPTNPYRED